MTRKSSFLLISLFLLLPHWSIGQETTTLTGAQFKAQLATPIAGITYNEAISGEALSRFANANSLEFLLDRRCPSDKLFTLNTQRISVRDFFSQVTDQLDWGVSYPGDVVYICPKQYAYKLRTLLQLQTNEVKKLSKEAVAVWSKRKVLTWEEGTTPKSILESLEKEYDIQIVGLDKFPHDVWRAGRLPIMSLVQRIQIIVGQFDLTFKFDSTGKKIALVPLNLNRIALVKSWADGGEAQERIARWKQELPNCEFIAKDNKIYVRGVIEDMERIQSNGTIRPLNAMPEQSTRYTLHSNQPANTAPLDRQRLTLPKVTVPPLALANVICQRFNLELECDIDQLREAGLAPEKVVEFEIKDATIDQFFQKLGEKAGCKMERQGNKIIVTP